MYKITKSEQKVIFKAVDKFGFIKIAVINDTYLLIYKKQSLVLKYGKELLSFMYNNLPYKKWYCTSQEAIDVLFKMNHGLYVKIEDIFNICDWLDNVEIVDD